MLTVSQRQRNVHANAIHENHIYESIRRGSGRGSFISRGGSFQRPGSMHHSASVRARQRAVFANARRDSVDY